MLDTLGYVVPPIRIEYYFEDTDQVVRSHGIYLPVGTSSADVVNFAIQYATLLNAIINVKLDKFVITKSWWHPRAPWDAATANTYRCGVFVFATGTDTRTTFAARSITPAALSASTAIPGLDEVDQTNTHVTAFVAKLIGGSGGVYAADLETRRAMALTAAYLQYRSPGVPLWAEDRL